MTYKVVRVVNETVVETNNKWNLHGRYGTHVKVLGLLSVPKPRRKQVMEQMAAVVVGKEIVIESAVYVAAGILHARVSVGGVPLEDSFKDRSFPHLPAARSDDPEDIEPLTRVHGGIPLGTWKNPIARLGLTESPYMGNMQYPVKWWEKQYTERMRLAEALHSESYDNADEMQRWLDRFLAQSRPEIPVLVEGPVGVGKSWFLARALSRLPRDRFHVIYIDLRSTPRGGVLRRHLEIEIDSFLTHQLTDHRWLHARMRSVYGHDFEPSSPTQKSEMRTIDLKMDREERNAERIRYYSTIDSVDLIVVFDNIDHYNENDQETIVDYCRRLTGGGSGVRVIFGLRPTTLSLKDRLGEALGDTLQRTLHLRSPDIHDVLRRRLTVNAAGNTWSVDEPIGSESTTWGEFLNLYRLSDYDWGAAGLLRGLCTTSSLGSVKVTNKEESAKDRLRRERQATFDCRHYLRLFRRLLRSDSLGGLKNIRSKYFAVQALMMRDGEPMHEAESFLFNLFDNDLPTVAGNALIRFRVLDYCQRVKDPGDAFDLYFDAIGCGSIHARAVLHNFVRAGLVVLHKKKIGGKYVDTEIELSIPGHRHLELVMDLWYIICIKTGMHIYQRCVLFGDEARRQAQEFVKNGAILEFYSRHGWVPEQNFFAFIHSQEMLELGRIRRFLEDNVEHALRLETMLRDRPEPLMMMYYAYEEQIRWWRAAARRPK